MSNQTQPSAQPSVIDRIVERNRAMWEFLNAPEDMTPAQKRELLDKWIESSSGNGGTKCGK